MLQTLSLSLRLILTCSTSSCWNFNRTSRSSIWRRCSAIWQMQWLHNRSQSWSDESSTVFSLFFSFVLKLLTFWKDDQSQLIGSLSFNLKYYVFMQHKNFVKLLKKCNAVTFQSYLIWYHKTHLCTQHLNTFKSYWKSLQQLYYDQT